MVRIINICSGKGGTGKTTVALHLAAALQKLGRSVAIVDCNLTTPHIGLHLNSYSQGRTLNDLLRGIAEPHEVMYTHASGLKFIPASLNIKELMGLDMKDIKDILKNAFSHMDFLLLDSAPGLGREAMIAMRSSDEVIFVANPFVPSVVDVARCKLVMEKQKPLGILLNRAKGKRHELKAEEIMRFADMPLIGVIPEDENVLRSVNNSALVDENTKAGRAFLEAAARLIGVEYKKRRFRLF